MDGIQLVYASPMPAELRARQLKMVEAGRMKVSETPATYDLLAAQERSAARNARMNRMPTLAYHSRMYLKYERLRRKAVRKLLELDI